MKRTKNNNIQMSFVTLDVDRRISRTATFYTHIDKIIRWDRIEKQINKHYKKGDTPKGNKPYSGLVLFKMLLIGIWNGLSDMKTEDHVNDSLSAMRFCGLTMEDSTPDHSTLSRFRNALTESKAMDKLLDSINKEFERYDVIVKGGVKVDATLTDSPYKPKGKTTYKIAQDRCEDDLSDEEREDQTQAIEKIQSPGVDKGGRWVKKGGKYHFGFKAQSTVDPQGLVLAVHTTAANEHDSRGFTDVLEKVDKKYTKAGVEADKAYKTPKNDGYLAKKNIPNRIMVKAYRNKPLTAEQKEFNRDISKTRWVVERTFGGIKKWFKAGIARYKGVEKTHTQHVLEAICYNLYRSPGIIVSNSFK